MPYTRRRRPRRSTRRRRRAAGSIQKAWRRRKRRKIGLVQRTLMSNRQQIRKIKKSQDTKMCSRVTGRDPAVNGGLAYSGQYVWPPITIDNDGMVLPAATTFFAPSLLQLPNNGFNFGSSGVPQVVDSAGANYARADQWVTMKSLTLKYKVQAGNLAEERLTLMLVLDRNPEEAIGNLNEILTSAIQLDTTIVNPEDFYRMAFQNLDNTGKEGRFKILWRKEHIVNPLEVQTENVPAIATDTTGTLPDVTRAAYVGAQFANPLRPDKIYGSVTIKSPYKLNYGTNPSNMSPLNQTIRLYAFAADTGSRASLGYQARFRFKE